MITKFDIGDRVRNTENITLSYPNYGRLKRGHLGTIEKITCESKDKVITYKVVFKGYCAALVNESQLISDEDWIDCERMYNTLDKSIDILETYQGELEMGCGTSSYRPHEIIDALENVTWAARGLMKIYDGEKED